MWGSLVTLCKRALARIRMHQSKRAHLCISAMPSATCCKNTAPQCTTLHHTAPHCTTLQHTALHLSMRCVASSRHCNFLQHTATHCNTLQYTATHCTTPKHEVCGKFEALQQLQHTAPHCNTPEHEVSGEVEAGFGHDEAVVMRSCGDSLREVFEALHCHYLLCCVVLGLILRIITVWVFEALHCHCFLPAFAVLCVC